MKFKLLSELSEEVICNISFYTSSNTRLAINNQCISVDYLPIFKQYSYWFFISDKLIDEYLAFLFFKKHFNSYIYCIDYSKCYFYSDYLVKVNEILLNLSNNLTLDYFAKELDINVNSLKFYLNGSNLLSLKKGFKLNSMLSINPEEYFQYRSNYSLFNYIKSFKCIKEK